MKKTGSAPSNYLDVLLVGASDLSGGAARAAYRLHRGLSSREEVRSRFLVQDKSSDDPSVLGPSSRLSRLTSKVRRATGKTLSNLLPGKASEKRSLNIVPSGLHRRINALDPDVVHLHWIGHETISIREVRKIEAPIVWTLHDMWAFQGVRHYTMRLNGEAPARESWGEHCLRWWKRYQWSGRDFAIVTPSEWLARKAKRSNILEKESITVIRNGLDLDTYKPLNQKTARSVLQLPQEKPLVLFGAVNALENPRKGADLLQPALGTLLETDDDAELVVFGESEEADGRFDGRVHYVGRLEDHVSLALLYSAADVFAMPSRKDNLPNTVAEAMACGTPCVGFNVGGVPEMIDHKKTGYVAEAFETDDLARGLKWTLASDRKERLSGAARQKACRAYDIDTVAQEYIDCYRACV